MEVKPAPPGETPSERRRRLAKERQRRYREGHRDELRERSRLRREAGNAGDERQRSQRRREQGTLVDKRSERQRSQRRREQGTHEYDQQLRSQRRREQGTHEHNQRQRSQRRREMGTLADARNQQQRSQRRRELGTHEHNQRQRSQRRRELGTHEHNQRQRSQRRRELGTHEHNQRQRSQRRCDEGTHADDHLRDRPRSFSLLAQAGRQHPFVAAVTALQLYKDYNFRMKNTKYVEDDSVDLSGFTLILPSVSVGNVGQLAVDLLLHNLGCRRVGAFTHPSLHAVVGNLPDTPAGGTHLMTAMEAYVCEEKKLLIVQIRGPISPRGRLDLLADLVWWSAARDLCRLLQLSSCHAASRPDPAAPRLCHLSAAGADTSRLADLVPPQPEMVPPDGERRPMPHLPGAGFTADLYRACDTAGFPYTCLLRHTYEGNNIPEAVDICDCLDSWLGLLDGQEQRPRPEPSSVLGHWEMPPTWSHLFGPAPDASLY